MPKKAKSLIRLSLHQQRKAFAAAMLIAAVVGVYYWFGSEGMPVWFAPSASAADIQAGRELFDHEWTPNDPLASGDGLGPVFNATSCAACHFQGGSGGGGDIGMNATHFDVLPRKNANEYLCGVIHSQSTNPEDKETLKRLKTMYPTIKGNPGTTIVNSNGSCSYIPPKPDVEPVRTVSVQSTALFGAGWLDKISTKAITQNHRRRGLSAAATDFKFGEECIPVGRLRILEDGRIGKFGWKAQFATLDEFVSAACANEIGLGTPVLAQATPVHNPFKTESKPDLTKKQFRELMAFVSTLPKPVEESNSEAEKGKKIFNSVGCAVCHVPNIGGVNGVYSDFLLYRLDTPAPNGGSNEYGAEPPVENQPPSHLPAIFEWRTPPLWGVADSAPYMHDGSASTLEDAIRKHQGDAKMVTAAYQKLTADEQVSVIKFLQSLKAPTDATPAPVKKTAPAVQNKGFRVARN